MADEFPLTKEEFDSIYSRVPRLNVEIILQGPDGIYLTKRDIEPCKGQWHLAGGTVYFGETLFESVKRIAKRELGIDVKTAEIIGYIEYPSHFTKGLDHPFGVAFKITDYTGEIKANKEANAAGWFKKLPKPMHTDQDKFLIKNKLIQK